MSENFVPALPAATVLLVQGSPGGIQVLMVRRKSRGYFGGLTVFPGGSVETYDTSSLAGSVVPGQFEDFGHRVAALREVAEETGLALTENGTIVAPDERGEALFRALDTEGVRFDASRLLLVSRWVTPQDAPRRFDARFYLAEVASPVSIRLDQAELVDHAWVSPGEALRKHEQADWRMFLPTLAHLRWLMTLATVPEALASARGADERSLIQPRVLEDGSIVSIYVPGQAP